ncbi:MAG: outer membrane beta-barrel domain-containing protein [Bacteriovoracaceae bacterium]|jgi:outer membrane beta-barrel protein|nr:outer membrane beta-barrel domain-containing protein [Bacteriovoracaceae bacterium]
MYILLLVISFSLFASEQDLYDFLWLDNDKKVYVLQNKLHPKKYKLFLDIGYIKDQTGSFQKTSGLKGALGYYISEEFSFEYQYATYSHSNNSTYDNVLLVSGIEPFIRRQNDSHILFFNWTPFYGKINTFNQIYYFDLGFGIGSGVSTFESNLQSVTNPSLPSHFKEESYNPVYLKVESKFYLNSRYHIGFEYINTNFKAATPKSPNSKSHKQVNELTLKLGVIF